MGKTTPQKSTKNFNQKGFTRNFLALMKNREDQVECCYEWLSSVEVVNSTTVILSGDGDAPLKADVVVSAQVGNALIVTTDGLYAATAGGTAGIDNVLAINQSLTTNRTITGSSSAGLTFAGSNLTQTLLGQTANTITGQGLSLLNNTTPAAGQAQYSPFILLQGRGLKSSGSLNQASTIRLYNKVAGGMGVTAQFTMETSIAGAAFSEILKIDASSKLTLTGPSGTIVLNPGGGITTTGVVGSTYFAGNVIGLNYQALTANYNMVGTETYIECTANTFIITLFNAVNAVLLAGSKSPFIYVINTGAGSVGLNTQGTDRIYPGALSTYTLASGKYVQMVATSTGKYLIVSAN